MIFGAVIDEKLKDEILVTVIATGFEHKAAPIHQSIKRPVSTGQPETAATR